MNESTGQLPAQKTCGSCGETFGCGAALDRCWCNELKISAESAVRLRNGFDDCLCPKCLTAVNESPAMLIKYPDGTVEVLAGAVRVDTRNFHEGMFDFYDEHGNLLRQIDMGSDISWEHLGPGTA